MTPSTRPLEAIDASFHALTWLWETRRGKAALPAWSSIDVLDLKPWLGNLMVLEVADGGRDFFYRVHGVHLAALRGSDDTGTWVSQASRNAERLLTEYRRAVEAAKPTRITREYLNADRDYMTVTKAMFPFASDGETVDRLLVAMYAIGKGE
ncbi:MAG: PAS domain-containing protein [Alphaproteobacteria bacterium]|jgi:hypothetical protein|nr:PAS domain-containing protein [Alphaproteobacteria bacterium]